MCYNNLIKYERRIEMTKDNRTEVRCSKTLNSGVIDGFSVIVPTSTRNDAKKKYEAMGYTVSVGR